MYNQMDEEILLELLEIHNNIHNNSIYILDLVNFLLEALIHPLDSSQEFQELLL